MADRPAKQSCFCPQCSHEVPRPTNPWMPAACPACGESSYQWELEQSPRLRRRFIPVLVVWSVLPAVFLVTGLLWPQPPADTAGIYMGSVLVSLAFHGGPAILYAWSAFLLRRSRVRFWWFLALPHATIMVLVNILLTVIFVPVLGQIIH